MSFTVVPLHNLDLGKGATIPFGKSFVLEDVPSWLTQNPTNSIIIADLSRHDRNLALASRHALITEYEANAIGYPDPEWRGINPCGIQSLRLEAAILANFCIWLIKPSAVCFTNAFHALTTLDNGQTMNPPFVLLTQPQAMLYCHPKDVQNEVTAQDIVRAGNLYDALSTIPRLGGHLKTGHTWPLQNRPTELNQNKSIYNPEMAVSASIFRNPA